MIVLDGFEHPETKIRTVRTIQESVHVDVFIDNLLRFTFLMKSNAQAKLRSLPISRRAAVRFSLWLGADKT